MMQERLLSSCLRTLDLSPPRGTWGGRLPDLLNEGLSGNGTVSPSMILDDISVLKGFVALTCLNLKFCHFLSDISPLAGCTNLRTLDLTKKYSDDGVGNYRPNDRPFLSIAPLQHCTVLRVLRLTGCDLLEDLSPLAHCALLERLSLERCYSVSDVSPLKELPCLHQLNILDINVYWASPAT